MPLGANEFFSDSQKARLRQLMDRRHNVRAKDCELSADEMEELEALVDDEMAAAIKRAQSILDRYDDSTLSGKWSNNWREG